MKAGFQVGDKVTLFPVTSCGNCEWCKKGMTQYCINAQTTGAFAEYVVTDISAVFKIPKDADLKKYALVEPTNCTLRAMDLAPVKHGSTVAIAGIGGIGSIMLNQILLSGAAKITAIDPVPEKRELALAMGAAHVIDRSMMMLLKEQWRSRTASALTPYLKCRDHRRRRKLR